MAKDKPLSKSEILNSLAEATDQSRKEVGAVLDALEGLIEENLTKGSGIFNLPGLMKIYVHRKKGVFHIALHNLKTGKISILTDTFLDESPSVAPNGNVIIYATKDRETDTDILAGVTINGKTRFILPSVSGGAREPAWSPILDKY